MNRTESNFKSFKNRPTSRIVCWKCNRSSVTLERVKMKGKKTPDYICIDCKNTGFYYPSIGNISKIKLQYV